MVYKLFDKKSKGSGVNIETMHSKQLVKESHKPIIRNFLKRKVYSGFRDNIWGADLADMQLIWVRISKYKNIFANGYTPNWSEEVFVVSKIKNIVPWTYVINDLNGEEIIGTSYEKELQKTNQQEFRIGKVIKRKYDKLYAKWKGYDNSFNSWIDKKDLV